MNFLDSFARKYLASHQNIKDSVKKAHLTISAEAYVKKSLKNALTFAGAFGAVTFFLTGKTNPPLIVLFMVFAVFGGSFIMFRAFFMKSADVKAGKRAKDVDREILFAGRFLLVKLSSGAPLLAALEEASKSYGVSSKYFAEIVNDIKLGTPIEEALEKAMDSTPSEGFGKILFQILNSIKIGVDVTDALQAILKEIAKEQLLEIKTYGNKLSTFTMMYMLIAIVVPSLGVTIATVILAMIGFSIGMPFYLVILVGITMAQMMFLVLFKSARPNLDL